ncbi:MULTISPECIES: hypothetical protein [unclassified Pseudoxanthomonas]|uniref:hypothetical protein n=1 Tax=unclassified Pseudoxanthomonas TaxID=2645906 RepID=UPI0008E9DA67|nr:MULTISPECIES: hypothetical protein [unclassified Pseudoxanthomonas]PPJ42431.1 hypothetical protein C0063_03910 [Pseudoxanthomonas sp. KAs_5_3]SFV27330.1 hypothetical protein SAMN05428990_0647 [Pseudoxanthomonas sp. YR558]
MSIRLSEKDSGRTLGNISEADFQMLVDYMEEESSKDQDYYVEHTAIDALESLGASTDFVALLRTAVGESEGVDVVWAAE